VKLCRRAAPLAVLAIAAWVVAAIPAAAGNPQDPGAGAVSQQPAHAPQEQAAPPGDAAPAAPPG
jgi:hypothetical protein